MPDEFARTDDIGTLTVKEERHVPIDYFIPDDLELTYSDVAYVQSTEDEFIVSFFQSEQPLIFKDEDLQKIEKVQVSCVARIVMSPNQMRKFFNALQTNIAKYDMRFKQTEAKE